MSVYVLGAYNTSLDVWNASSTANPLRRGGPLCPPAACRIFIWFTSCSVLNPLCRGGPLRPPVLTELILCTKCCGFTACSFTAVTKTTGMITSSRRVFGSRNRGNGMFCLVFVWFIPPVVYASGLHQTRRSAHACRIYLRFWMLGFTACSFTNALHMGGPLCPPETTELAHRCIPTIDFPINLIAHLCRVTHHVHSIVCPFSSNMTIMWHLIDGNRSNKLFQRLKYIQNAFLRNKSWRFLEVVCMIGHHQYRKSKLG